MRAEAVTAPRTRSQSSWRHLHVAAACVTFVVLVSALAFFAVFHVPAQPAWERYDPEDDEAWAAISPGEVTWAAVEPLEGMSAERVIDVLGPPAHSRRRVEASARCTAVYLYPIRTAGRHGTVGLCIDAEGRVNGSVGQHKLHFR
jgi:hypothetical protein